MYMFCPKIEIGRDCEVILTDRQTMIFENLKSKKLLHRIQQKTLVIPVLITAALSHIFYAITFYISSLKMSQIAFSQIDFLSKDNNNSCLTSTSNVTADIILYIHQPWLFHCLFYMMLMYGSEK